MRGKRYLFRRDADDAFIFCSKFSIPMPVATSSSFVFFSLDEAGVGDLFFFDDESRDARGTMVVLLVLGTRIIIIIARRVLRLLLLLLPLLLSGGRIF